MSSFLTIGQFILGMALLLWSAERFIDGSVSLAENLKIPKLIIGILLVGFGTSFPEMVVAIVAAMHQKSHIAIGNVVGSNIANIGLVLGLAAIITPLHVDMRFIKKEFPILIGVSIVVGLLLFNGYLSRIDGVILIVLLAMHLYWIITSTKDKEKTAEELLQGEPNIMPLKKGIFYCVLGIVLIFVSSELLINSAVTIAKWFGLSDLVIGITIVAIGTSLPELAATITSAFKKEHDIAVGHVVGSNIFNLLVVLAMPALIAPGQFPMVVVYRDFPIMMLFTVALWVAALYLPQKIKLGRLVGVVFLLGYIGYITSLLV